MVNLATFNGIDFNAVFDDIVRAQGSDVQPGGGKGPDGVGAVFSDAWGGFAYSGTTGGHPTYGYRHLHKLKRAAPDYVTPLSAEAQNKIVRAILSMCCNRHTAYFGPDAEIRKDGYEYAGRPYGQVGAKLPDTDIYMENDSPFGGTLWPNPNGGDDIQWHTWDAQHPWTMLPDVMRLAGVTVPLLPNAGVPTWDAASLAWGRLQVETFGIVGIYRNPYYLGFYPEVNGWSDRGAARMLQWTYDAWLVNALDTSLYEPFFAFIKSQNNFYKKAPGCSRIDKFLTAEAPYVNGDTYFQCHNLSQVGAAFYDIANALELTASFHATLIAELRASCMRIGQWIADCITTAGPKSGVMPFGVHIPQSVVDGVGGAPVPSLTSYLDGGTAVRYYETFDVTPWAYRGLHCAGVLGNADAAARAATILSDWDDDETMWSFLVNADRTYAVAGAAAAAGE